MKEESQRGKNGFFFVKCLIGFFLITIVLLSTDWHASIVLLSQLSPLPALGALLLIPLGYLVSAYRWSLLLAAHKIHQPLAMLWRVYWIGSFANNFLPTSVGGDIVRLGFLGKLGRSAQVASSIVMERLSGFFVLIALAGFVLLANPKFFGAVGLLKPLGLVVILSSTGLIILFLTGEVLGGWLKRETAYKNTGFWRYLGKVEKVVSAVLFYRGQRRVFWLNLGLSIVFYLVVISIHCLCINALNQDIPILAVLVAVPLVILISFLPLSVNAIGLAEGATILVYSRFGLTPEQSLAIALLVRIVQMLSSIPGGVLLVFPVKSCVKKL